MNWRTSVVLQIALLCAHEASAANADWPQWRGPSRDGTAVNSPKLLDAWPKDGPRLLWKSSRIPSGFEGGCGSPIVADGKVFLYVNWKHPRGNETNYHLITAELLSDAGWLPDLPAELAQKIETAWAAPSRPSSAGWRWWDVEWTVNPKDKELDAFLAKSPELDKYIKDFIATLDPNDAKKYGTYIKRRLCISTERSKWGVARGFSWDELTKLNTFKDKAFPTYREWLRQLSKEQVHFPGPMPLRGDIFKPYAWTKTFTMSDSIVCLDAATGKELWKKEFPEDESIYLGDFSEWDWHRGDFANLGASGTMAFMNGKCYAAGAMGLYCLSAKDGAMVWSVKGKPEHSSPLVANGVVYSCGVAYNAENGSVLWKHPLWKEPRGRDELARYAPALLWSSGGKHFILSTDNTLGGNSAAWTTSCLELETGKVAWSQKGGAPMLVSADTMVLSGKTYKISPSGVEPLASFTEGQSLTTGVVHQGYLYSVMNGGDGGRISLCCSDMKTGETKWKGKCPFGEGVLTTPVLADGKMLVPLVACHNFHGGAQGQDLIEWVKLSPDEKYVQLGLFNPKTLCSMTSPAVAGGRLFLRLEDGIACYDLADK